MEQRVRRPSKLLGTLVVPGDKSISHRAALFNAIADGTARVVNYPDGADCGATLACLRDLGVGIEQRPSAEAAAAEGALDLTVHGVGLHGLREPEDILDAQNSGTTMRLLLGILAGQPFFSILTGDASLRGRPMDRVTEPLREMGARITGRDGGSRAPLGIEGGSLRAIDYRTPVASAQVKSSLLLAGLYAKGTTMVDEPADSRDHTERLLAAMGAACGHDGHRAWVGPSTLRAVDLRIPGDFSAAAYWLVAAVLHPNASIRLRGVGINPTRTGLLDTLRAMGANIRVENERWEGGEPVADLWAESSSLEGTEVAGDMIPRLIDEAPVLAVAAALARGTTVIRDAAELRVKESDRIATTTAALRRFGADIDELPDGMVIRGRRSLHGATVASQGDHRLAMALAVAGLLAEGETVVQDAEAVAVSYPRFWEDIHHFTGA